MHFSVCIFHLNKNYIKERGWGERKTPHKAQVYKTQIQARSGGEGRGGGKDQSVFKRGRQENTAGSMKDIHGETEEGGGEGHLGSDWWPHTCEGFGSG